MSKLVIEVVYRGREKRVVWTSDDSGRMHGKSYYEKLDHKERAKFRARFEHLGNKGEIRNEEQFRHEVDGIYAIKIPRHRLLCFFDLRDVVITHGLKKQKDKLHRKELDKARRIRSSYYGARPAPKSEGI